MPSPIGHTIAGFCGYLLVPKGSIPKPPLNALFASIVVANLADIDIVPGLMLGNPSLFHRQATHSVTASVCVGIIVCFLGRWTRAAKPSVRLGIWAAALYFSHIFLDLLVTDLSPPRGVQLFWPFSEEYVISPVTIFGGFNYFNSDIGMIRSMLSRDNLMTVVWESCLMFPIYGLVHSAVYSFRRKRKQQQKQ